MKKKSFKLNVISIVIIMIGVMMMSGCDILPNKYGDEALEYLNERYGFMNDTYTEYSFFPSSWETNVNEVVFKSKKYNDATFSVKMAEVDGKTIIEDSYYMLYLKDDFENLSKKIAKDNKMECEIAVSFATHLVNPPLTIEEALKSDLKEDIDIRVFSLSKYSKQEMEKYVAYLKKNDLAEGYVEFYTVDSFETADKYKKGEITIDDKGIVDYRRCGHGKWYE